MSSRIRGLPDTHRAETRSLWRSMAKGRFETTTKNGAPCLKQFRFKRSLRLETRPEFLNGLGPNGSTAADVAPPEKDQKSGP